MRFDRRHFVSAGAGMLAAGCSLTSGARRQGFARPAPLTPLRISSDQLMKITVCTRPFRAAGPRLEAEAADGKKIVHNYGHGGSGWSLSWGCAEEAATLALVDGSQRIAVIGAGVMGLTTGLLLVERGADVTIYAKEFPAETRSARATGVWSPSSRIGLADVVENGFGARWEQWARTSYARHQQYVGAAAEPVEYLQQYALFDADNQSTPASHDFLHLDSRLRGLTPPWSAIAAENHPFPVSRVRGGLNMTFNVASYAGRLTRDFLLRGGRMIRRDFPDRAAIVALPEPVVVNCTGYGARRLWGDESLTPVRGQINWLAPQPQARYGFFYRGVFTVSRRDGVVVQYVGPNDDWGLGDANESPDREETSKALSAIAPLFS